MNNYHQMGRKDQRIVQALLEYKITGRRCLDIGPGSGRWLKFLKSNGASYLAGIDFSQTVVAKCKSICDYVQFSDIEQSLFCFNSNTFDIILFFEVLEHLRYPELCLSEICRVLKEGGLLLISIPNILSLISRVRVLFGLLPSAIASDDTHVRFYRQKELQSLLEPFNLTPEFIPTSILLNPFNSKGIRIPSKGLLSCLDDSILVKVIKKEGSVKILTPQKEPGKYLKN